MRRGMVPNTEWNSDRICSRPLFPDMTYNDVDDVVNAVKDVLCERRGSGRDVSQQLREGVG